MQIGSIAQIKQNWQNWYSVEHLYNNIHATYFFSKEKEIASLQQKVEEDASEVAALQKKIRELEAKISELEEDLENEKMARQRVSWEDWDIMEREFSVLSRITWVVATL